MLFLFKRIIIKIVFSITSALNASSERLLNTNSINRNSGLNANILSGSNGINNSSTLCRHTFSKYSLNHTNNLPNSSSSSSGLIDAALEERTFGSHNHNNTSVLSLPYDKGKPFTGSNVSILLDRNSWALHNQALIPTSIKASSGSLKTSSLIVNESPKEIKNVKFERKVSKEVLALEPLLQQKLPVRNEEKENVIKKDSFTNLTNFNNTELENNFISCLEDDVLM